VSLVSAGDPSTDEGSPALDTVLTRARIVTEATRFARDLTNTPGDVKSPGWFVEQVTAEAGGLDGLTVTVRDRRQLAADGFGGLLAVGAGSSREPRLLELSWWPHHARAHVVLVGKGITFDTGGICIKPRDAMRLMRKDMGGAAAVMAATLAAAQLGLPVRISTLAPLAENSVSGAAVRPGDVIRHYGGITSEVRNTDAEGRLVLADALAYAVRQLRPDVIVDLATLTGAQSVALGKRTAALFTDDDALAADLSAAAAAGGERLWRLPLCDDYVDAVRGEETDLLNATDIGAGAITAALFLREFTGEHRRRWAHIDMSAPAWSDGVDGELVKGATGWGVRTLLCWLASVAG
jgi:leucyl aminopeptidase